MSAPRPIAAALPFAHDAAGFDYFRSDHHHRHLVAAIHRHFAKGSLCLLVSGAIRADGELVERFINENRDSHYRAAMAVCRPGTDLGDLVRAFCRQLGLRHEEQSGALWTLLSHVMLEARNGIRRVFIIDKAELMDATCLDELLRLTRLDEPNVVPVVLLAGPAGSPALQASCDRLALASDGKITFERLAAEEVAAFIRYQLNVYAGSDASLFSPAVVAEIAAKAAGDPGAVNREARRVLAAAGMVWTVEPDARRAEEPEEKVSVVPPPAAQVPPSTAAQPPSSAEEPLLLSEPDPDTESTAPDEIFVPSAKRRGAPALAAARGAFATLSELPPRLGAATRQLLAAGADGLTRVRIPPMVATGLYAVLILAIGGGLLYALLPSTPPQHPAEPVIAEAAVPALPQPEPGETAPAPTAALPDVPPPPSLAETPAPVPETSRPQAVAAAPAAPAQATGDTPAAPTAVAAPVAVEPMAAPALEPAAGAPEPPAAAPAPAPVAALPDDVPPVSAAAAPAETAVAAAPPASEPAPAAPAAETNPPAPVAEAPAAEATPPAPVAAPPAAEAARPAGAASTTSPAPASPSVAALEPQATPAAPPAASAASEAAMMVERGNRMLASGDIASARRFYERGAADGNGAAACGLGKTYDPLFLKQLGARGLQGNVGAAMAWYRRAVEEGSAEAATRLERLHAAYPAY